MYICIEVEGVTLFIHNEVDMGDSRQGYKLLNHQYQNMIHKDKVSHIFVFGNKIIQIV